MGLGAGDRVPLLADGHRVPAHGDSSSDRLAAARRPRAATDNVEQLSGPTTRASAPVSRMAFWRHYRDVADDALPTGNLVVRCSHRGADARERRADDLDPRPRLPSIRRDRGARSVRRTAAAKPQPAGLESGQRRQAGEVRHLEVGGGVGRGRGPEPGPIVAAVDPDRGQPQLLGRDVVVVQALGDVEDPLRRDVDRPQGQRGTARCSACSPAPARR